MLKNLPNQHLAYLPQANAEALAECLVAFANSSGGTIILGVTVDGRLADTVWEEDAEGALREAATLCRPPIPTEWQLLESGQGTLITIQVSHSPELHTFYDGRVLVRHGRENRALLGSEIRDLANSKNAAEFETNVVPGARSDDLNPDVIREYLEKRESRGSAKVTDTDDFSVAHNFFI